MHIFDIDAFVMETKVLLVQTTFDGIHNANYDNKIFKNKCQ